MAERRFPRILAIVNEPNGCDVWRVIIPLHNLKKRGYPTAMIRAASRVAIEPITRDYEVIVFPRLKIIDPVQRVALFNLLRQRHQVVTYELDDDLWSQETGLGAWERRIALAHHEIMIRESDAVTVSTEQIRAAVLKFNKHVTVIPNAIDPDLWDFKRLGQPVRKVPGLTIGVHGGMSHDKDWAILPEIFLRLAALYPAHPDPTKTLRFVVAGHHPEYILALQETLGDRLVLLPWVPINEYPFTVAQLDIGLCPLPETPFNRAKTPIKILENALVGAPSVVSPTIYGPEVVEGRTGYTATTIEEWVTKAQTLIDDPQRRRQIGQEAKRQALERHHIKDTVGLWRDFYRDTWRRVQAEATKKKAR